MWTITYNGNPFFNYTGNNPIPIIIQDTGSYAVYVLAWNACDSIILIDTFRNNLPSTLILPNVTIGNGCAVGALTLINQICDEFTIYSGNPANKIGKRLKRFLKYEKDII